MIKKLFFGFVILSLIFMFGCANSNPTPAQVPVEAAPQVAAPQIEAPKVAPIEAVQNNTPDTPDPNARPEVGAVLDGKTFCTPDEARALAKQFLVTEDRPAYLVTTMQNFDEKTYVKTYNPPKCKIYAPTQQQFKGFVKARNFTELTLTNSTMFVDDGEGKKSDQYVYEFFQNAKYAKILSGLEYDTPQGSTEKIIYNVTVAK